MNGDDGVKNVKGVVQECEKSQITKGNAVCAVREP